MGKPKECENGCPPKTVCDYCQGTAARDATSNEGEGLIKRLRTKAGLLPMSFGSHGNAMLKAADWIEKLERENLELRHDLDRGMANHNADLSAASETRQSEPEVDGGGFEEGSGPYNFTPAFPRWLYTSDGTAIPVEPTAPTETPRSEVFEAALATFPRGYDEEGVYTEWKERLDAALKNAAPQLERHVDGRWCKDRRCAKCYSAPSATRLKVTLEDEANIAFLQQQDSKSLRSIADRYALLAAVFKDELGEPFLEKAIEAARG